MARRTRRGRTAIVASSLLACGSAQPKPVSPQPATATPTKTAAPQLDPALLAMLDRDALYDDAPIRRTVYTWTTTDQIAELRKTRQLLTRTESPEHGASYIEHVLHALAPRDPIAKLLYTTTFARMRFAWHAPWATRDGWPGEQYGDALIRVTLKPGAIALTLDTRSAKFGARDMANQPVALAEVSAHPERIAAIYFTSDVVERAAPGLPPPTATFREIVLCNESMIESWEVGTPAIEAELEAGAKLLEAFARYLISRPATELPMDIAGAWRTRGSPTDPDRAFAAALAFDSPSYFYDANRFARLASQLRTTPKFEAVTHTGSTTFAGAGTPRPPPRVVAPADPQPRGTYLGTYIRKPRPSRP